MHYFSLTVPSEPVESPLMMEFVCSDNNFPSVKKLWQNRYLCNHLHYLTEDGGVYMGDVCRLL